MKDENTVNTNILLMHLSSYLCVSWFLQTVWVQLQPYGLQASGELSFEQASLGAVPIVTLTSGTDKEVIRAEWNPVSIHHPTLMILLQN